MAKKSYDFSGWATKYNIKCSDGCTISQGAFKDQDGQTIPLVWNHDHKEQSSVIGHALLKQTDEGVYAYCSLNETENGKTARILVENGDITSLSIYANKLTRKGSEVQHGTIRELSLVLAGANPEAQIDNVLAHGESIDKDDYMCYAFDSDINVVVAHSDELDEKEAKNMPTEENTVTKEVVENKDDSVEHAEKTESEETVADVFNTLSDKQKTVVYAIMGQLLEDNGSNKNTEDKEMKHNAFEENENKTTEEKTELTHSEFLEIMKDAKALGDVKSAFIQHGITDVSNLFPEHKAVGPVPATLNINNGWVARVMAMVKHSPFARVKSSYVDITADDARAKGYVTGEEKVEEVIAAIKRTTDPTTVYKYQKMNRDDILDITDFDVLAYLKQEMRVKLEEEIAHALLIGDGRSSVSDDKINPLNIRPIWQDNSAYVVNTVMTRGANDTDYTFAKEFIRKAIKARKQYKGSGRPVFITGEDMLANLLLIEDTNGRAIYEDEAALARKLRASEIITVPYFDSAVREGSGDDAGYDFKLMGMFVNLSDYNVGADKGGNVSFFEDFNLSYNKQEYLIETRCSGALVVPKSALTFEEKVQHVA